MTLKDFYRAKAITYHTLAINRRVLLQFLIRMYWAWAITALSALLSPLTQMTVASPLALTGFKFCTGPDYTGTCSAHLSTDADFSACRAVPTENFTIEVYEVAEGLALLSTWYATTDCTGETNTKIAVGHADSVPNLDGGFSHSWNMQLVVW